MKHEGANGIDIHTCPKCGTLIEKDGGCPEMHCSMCKYDWCWTCGFAKDSSIHKITGNGIPCKLINAFTFGFECKFCHWTLRLIVSTLVAVLLPALIYIACVVLFTWAIYYNACNKGKKVFCCIKRKLKGDNCIKVLGSFILMMIVSLVEFGLIFSLSALLGTLLYAIIIGPIVIYLAFLFVRILY